MITALRAKVTDAPITEGAATFLNPHSYLLLRPHADLLEHFDAVYLDGISMVVAVRRLLGIRVERRSFDLTSLAPGVFAEASRRGTTMAVVGGEPGVAEAAVDSFTALYGPLSVGHVRDGYFASRDERAATVRRLAELDPGLLIVGMGTPGQEELVSELRAEGWRGLAYTCGGFLHQTAGSRGDTYYPRFFDRSNLRWLYRIIDEPRLATRYFVRYPWFVMVFVWDVVRDRMRGSSAAP